MNNRGTVTFVDTSSSNGPGSIQVNFDLDAGGGIGATPLIISDQPRQMIIKDFVADTYVYGAAP